VKARPGRRDTGFPEARAVITALEREIPGFTDALAVERWGFETWKCMPEESYLDKDVLDLGCGLGASSAVFLDRGARFVWGVDPELPSERVERLAALPRSRFSAGVLGEVEFGEQQFDLIYARAVTEHIYDLPAAVVKAHSLLRSGGRFVALHDNYYGPMGAHDQGMFRVANGSDPMMIERVGVPCWTSPDKCRASESFREQYAKDHDWQVTRWALTPDDCERCSYFQRAQLWAHLRYQDQFPAVFAGKFFHTRTDGGLNKVTAFQLRQFLVEAGFTVTTWMPVHVANVPPPELLANFTLSDLQTGPLLFAADKE